MNSNKLSINGGEKIIKNNFKIYNTIGDEEKYAVTKILDSGVLSKYLGCWHDDFYGGPKVREFENAWSKYFGVKHAVTVNSWSSGLTVAVGAIGIEPGDEVIVTPWTMSATATSILHWNAVPVFADIDRNTYNIDPKSIEANVTPHTKAILAVDIFGQSADMEEIMAIANSYNLKVISDTAQAPGAFYKGSFAGTHAHIGGYSLNYHKHIHTGEGGVLVTNDDDLAEKMRLIRNHAEVVVGDLKSDNIINMIGHNYRLGEIECTIGIEQLKKLSCLVKRKQEEAELLTKGLKDLKGLKTPIVGKNRTHVYYSYCPQIDSRETGVSRDKICEALTAEGVPASNRYSNLHLLPVYQKRIAYGSKGFPWSSDVYAGNVNYEKGICPIAEYLNENSYIGMGMCLYDYTNDDINLIVKAFHKVWDNLDQL